MRFIAANFIIGLTLSLTPAASACSVERSSHTPAKKRQLSKPVAVDRMCRTVNIGVADWYALGKAVNLGDGRIVQTINDLPHQVLLSDCNTREVTVLHGKPMGQKDSCGFSANYRALTGPDATVELNQGANLQELVTLAKAEGAFEQDPVELFFRFGNLWSGGPHKVSRKDQFDLLCGCTVYYRNSPGASK